MKVVSLFSGAGGLDLGFIKANHEIVWANDFDKYAVETYKNNIGSHIVYGDITKIDAKDVPSCEIIIGGFPCQGFSIANTKRHIGDERNKLYLELLRFIKDKQPPLLEDKNTPNHFGTKHKVKINGYLGNRAVDWDKPSPTILGRGGGTGGPVIIPHPELHRRMTVRETARIQTFPDDFIFHGSMSAQYRQIGNALPPVFSYHLAKIFPNT